MLYDIKKSWKLFFTVTWKHVLKKKPFNLIWLAGTWMFNFLKVNVIQQYKLWNAVSSNIHVQSQLCLWYRRYRIQNDDIDNDIDIYKKQANYDVDINNIVYNLTISTFIKCSTNYDVDIDYIKQKMGISISSYTNKVAEYWKL